MPMTTARAYVTKPVLDAAGACPGCSLEAAKLDIGGRFWWLEEFGQSDDHQPGCVNEGGPTLARLRMAWLQLQALLHPNRPCAVMPSDPDLAFWPSYRPPRQRTYQSGGRQSPYELIKASMSIHDAAAMLGVRLRAYGNRERGLCPLHEERSPSFTVYSDQQSFYCFGCNRGGDLITLLGEAGKLAQFMAAAR